MLSEAQNKKWAEMVAAESPAEDNALYIIVQKIAEAFGRIAELEKENAALKKNAGITENALKRTIDNLAYHHHSADGKACTPLAL